MGAVSSLILDQRVLEEVPVNHNLFGGGYFDNWGSIFRLRYLDGRVMLTLDNVGGYLHPTALNGWENDRNLKAVREEQWSGVFSLWALNRGQDDKTYLGEIHDLDYGFIKNELMFVSQNGVVFWKSPAFMGNVEELVQACYAEANDFFDYEWTKPKTMATLAECALFPLRRKYVPPSKGPHPTLTYKETISPAQTKFMNAWLNEFGLKGN